jgi:DNA-binding MarR family transcriptional regulator
MNLATQSIPPEIQNMMAGLFNALNLFEVNLPASYVRAFVAVAKNEGRCVHEYARVCNTSNGSMSRRLNDLGETDSRDRSKAGYGLLESRPDPMDRRFTNVKLSAKGKNFVGQIVRSLEYGASN